MLEVGWLVHVGVVGEHYVYCGVVGEWVVDE